MNDTYHIPVLLKESTDALKINPKGIYVDLTFGGGGHTVEILKQLTTGKLIAFDQDADAEKNIDKVKRQITKADNLIFFRSNFKFLSNFIKYAGYKKVDGILADLGVSSHQINNEKRGFSYRLGGVPDMRMNTDAKLSSIDILNSFDEERLFIIFKEYGELNSAGKLASAILKFRETQRINNIEQLNQIINQTIKSGKEFKILSKVYQALRIETNNELDALKIMLNQTKSILNKNGRLVVISYHSLEDRIVKNFIKYNNFEGKLITDIYGNPEKEFVEINKKVLIPSDEEILLNNRARSAKLRIAEKL
jgi:16S rRNA (cytosine1402-N4)-methyltransferase